MDITFNFLKTLVNTPGLKLLLVSLKLLWDKSILHTTIQHYNALPPPSQKGAHRIILRGGDRRLMAQLAL